VIIDKKRINSTGAVYPKKRLNFRIFSTHALI
jgi:hypothetical protein